MATLISIKVKMDLAFFYGVLPGKGEPIAKRPPATYPRDLK